VREVEESPLLKPFPWNGWLRHSRLEELSGYCDDLWRLVVTL
jgi:hypothetical protein